jgi:YidC/Oxa1 family membrane protein insertase
MERGNIGRWLLIASGIFLLFTFLGPGLFGGGDQKTQPLKAEGTSIKGSERPPAKECDIWTPEFQAVLSTRSASLRHFRLLTSKYQDEGKPIDLSTTPDYEPRQQLRFEFWNPASGKKEGTAQLEHDLVDYELVKSDGKSCEFKYRDERTEITKVVRATNRPYELAVETSIKNLADKPLAHAVTVHTDAWRTESEVKGGMFRVSPLVTHVECVAEGGKTKRLNPGDFAPDDFEDRELFPVNSLTQGDWYQMPGKPAVAAVSNAYFSHALVPLSAPVSPVCQLQIEQRWDNSRYKSHGADPQAGSMYRARLAYEKKELKPGESATYSLLSYIGPKERNVLAQAADGKPEMMELIDLGFFSAIAKVLVAFLLKVHSIIPNWGIAIIVLTLTARLLTFPLALPGIRNMIRMRELKPEIDALNEKFKDDPQAKGLAQMELWRKHNVNPLKGCLPQLASMPIWFALYTTLQTAVELYNIPFLWFPNLAAKDPLYILPFIIGGTSYLQQRLMPIQAEPAQQKMMLYFMPAMFTVFMLFLPAGLGVYMFTNGVLGILQQQAVEWHARRHLARGGSAGDGGIKVKVVEENAPGSRKSKSGGASAGGKGSHDASGKDSKAPSDGSRLLGKGKA